jgi:hypothetical protein
VFEKLKSARTDHARVGAVAAIVFAVTVGIAYTCKNRPSALTETAQPLLNVRQIFQDRFRSIAPMKPKVLVSSP